MSSTYSPGLKPRHNEQYHPFDDPAADLPRRAKDDALDDIEYQLLIEACHKLDPYHGQQARFCILLTGRLGLRKGELAHMKAEWVDWRRSMICIPRHEPCEKGRGGCRCGDCRQKARQKVDHADDAEKPTFERALAYRWEPKTEAASRKIPFDHDPRVQLAVERFFDRYDEWPLSYQTVTRKVKRAAEASPLDPERVYPHCLRATAASYLANRGLPQIPLQSLMGWVDMKTARSYITTSGTNTQAALKAIHAM